MRNLHGRLLTPLLGALVWLHAVAAFAEPPATIPAEISFELVLPSQAPIHGALLLAPAGKSGDAVEVPILSAAPVTVSLPRSSSWEVSARVEGFWVPRQPLEVGGSDEVPGLTLKLWPLGSLSGKLAVADQRLDRPRQVMVKTLEVPAHFKRPPVPPGTLECPVNKDGEFQCSLPAASFDLAVSAPGFIPHYRWSVKVPAGGRIDVGSVLLERGASLAGWVAAEGGVLDPEFCVATLTPLGASEADPQVSLRLLRTSLEQPVGPDGFLQWGGLAPGVYALEVRQPGWAAATLSRVRVSRETETFLPEVLVLHRPLDLEISFSPPLDRAGKPWAVRITRVSASGGRVAQIAFDGAAGETGELAVGDQRPGEISLAVTDSEGNRFDCPTPTFSAEC